MFWRLVTRWIEGLVRIRCLLNDDSSFFLVWDIFCRETVIQSDEWSSFTLSERRLMVMMIWWSDMVWYDVYLAQRFRALGETSRFSRYNRRSSNPFENKDLTIPWFLASLGQELRDERLVTVLRYMSLSSDCICSEWPANSAVFSRSCRMKTPHRPCMTSSRLPVKAPAGGQRLLVWMSGNSTSIEPVDLCDVKNTNFSQKKKNQ